MNTLPAVELKRRGMAAVEEGLRHGPVHILKRNRPAAVVLSEQEYQRLLARAGEAETAPGPSALEWLLAQEPGGRRSTADIDRQINDERDGWDR
jgi:PHD/YefM family antitoxin component YafN of YafNO toxin-antitoxin module